MKTNLNIALATCALFGFLFLGASESATTTSQRNPQPKKIDIQSLSLPPAFYFQLFVSLCTGTPIDLSVVGAQGQVFQYENQLNQIR